MNILFSLSLLKECLVSRVSLTSLSAYLTLCFIFRLHIFAENKNYFGNTQNAIQGTYFLEIRKSCVSFQTIDHL